jgi:hypothetical protein
VSLELLRVDFKQKLSCLTRALFDPTRATRPVVFADTLTWRFG